MAIAGRYVAGAMAERSTGDIPGGQVQGQALRRSSAQTPDAKLANSPSEESSSSTQTLNASVSSVLLDAGMAPADALLLAPTLTPEQVNANNFGATLKERLQKADSPNDAVLWASYQGTALESELEDSQFKADLREDHRLNPQADPKQHVHYARALGLYRSLGGFAPLNTVLALDAQTLQALQGMKSKEVQALLDSGKSLADIGGAASSGFSGIQTSKPSADPKPAAEPKRSADDLVATVKDRLTKAGMSPEDAETYSGQVSSEELHSTQFMGTLQTKLAAGAPAGDAIIWARYQGLASKAELSDPQFIKDLTETPTEQAQSAQTRLLYAQASLLVRRLENAIDLPTALNLDEQTLSKLLAADPAKIKKFAEIGLTPAQFIDTTADQREDLLAAKPEAVKGLLSASMSVQDVLSNATSITDQDIANPDFFFKLADNLDQGLAAPKAIIAARKSDLTSPTPEELADPQFIQDMSDAKLNDYGDTGENKLKYARASRLARELQIPLATVLKLDLAPLTGLLKLDAESLKELSDAEHSLDELAALTPETLARVSQMDADLKSWIVQLTTVSLPELGKLTDEDIVQLKAAKDDGVRTADSNQTFDEFDIDRNTISYPIQIGGGAILFDSYQSGKVIVFQNTNRGLFSKVTGLLAKKNQPIVEDVRAQAMLPPQAMVNVMELSTNVLEKPDDPTSPPISVGQLVMQTMAGKYRDMLDNQEITSDDPRAKFVETIEARSALTNGYDLLPYYETDDGFGGTQRTYPGGEDTPFFQRMSPKDVGSIINEGAVDNKLLSLLGDDSTIQTDYQAAIASSVNALPNKQEVIDRLYNSITSPEYIKALKVLKDSGMSYDAEQMTQRDITALAALDNAKSAEAAQKLRINSLGADFQDLVDDPSMVDTESFAVSTEDAISVAMRTLRLGAAHFRHGSQIVMDLSKYFNEFKADKISVAALGDTIKQLVIEAKKGNLPTSLGDITQAQFDDAMKAAYLPPEMRGKLTGFFTVAQKYGVWGSISGSAALAGFAYRLSKGAWSAESSSLERWGAARDLIAFLTVGQHVLRTGSGIFDLGAQLLGKGGPDAHLAYKALGLDRSLPEVWGKTSFLPDEQTWAEWAKRKRAEWGNIRPDNAAPVIPEPGTPQALAQGLLADERGPLIDNANGGAAFAEAADQIQNLYDNTAAGAVDAAAGNNAEVKAAIARLGAADLLEPTKALKPLGNVASRIGLSAFKVLTTVVDLVGVADIVMGGLYLKKAIQEGDVPGIVGNSLGIVGGAALTGAGAIGTATLFAPVPALASAAVAPLFLAGSFFALVGFGALSLTQAYKRHNALQNSSDKQGEWFKNLSQEGLTASDWDNRLEYLRYAFAWYGNDNLRREKSYFEMQKEEWAFFQATQAQNGSSLNRLNEGLHLYTNQTWKSPTGETPMA
jgi:hypothetical protein